VKPTSFMGWLPVSRTSVLRTTVSDPQSAGWAIPEDFENPSLLGT
jgi:hypothetical protein